MLGHYFGMMGFICVVMDGGAVQSAQTLLAKCLLNKLVYLHFGTVGAELSGSFIVVCIQSLCHYL